MEARNTKIHEIIWFRIGSIIAQSYRENKYNDEIGTNETNNQ